MRVVAYIFTSFMELTQCLTARLKIIIFIISTHKRSVGRHGSAPKRRKVTILCYYMGFY